MSTENMPGAFPGIPEERDEDIMTDEIDKSTFLRAPSAREFTFTPTKQPLYPSLDHMTLKSSTSTSSLRLAKECQNLGYSKKLSNNVLEELEQRAAQKKKTVVSKSSSRASKKAALSPRTSRFNSSHRSKFGKMESISSHYAAVRSKGSMSSLRREEVDQEKENVPLYTPRSKRDSTSILGSITKRRKTDTGKQEVRPTLSSSSKSNDLASVLQRPSESSRIPRSPSKPSLHAAMEQQQHQQPRQRAIPHSRTVSQNISGLSPAKQLPRSSTLQNLTKPTASSLQRSSSNRNLGQTLTSQASMSSLSSYTSLSSAGSQHSLSRAKSSLNLKQNNTKPVWR